MIEQNQTGHHNVSVAVDGNKNTVTIALGAASLTLDRAHRRRRSSFASNRHLLLTESRATTLVGRDAELERFGGWLESPTPLAVHCVIGRGGAGKTRFGIELCERAEAKGWTAGFVTGGELIRFHEKQSLSGWLWHGPTLLVIDYAAAKVGILRDWLDELARYDGADAASHPLRILLLERHADRGIGWWSELGRQGGLSGLGGDSLVDGVEPFALPSLTDVDDRRRLMAEAMALAATLKPDAPAPRLPEPGADPAFDQALSAGRIDNEPLYLMMAAIVAVDRGAPAALTLSRTQLAETIARHEMARLEKIAKGHGIDPDLFTHMAACVTLQGGGSQDDAERLIEQERATDPTWSSVSPRRVAEWLADGLPGPDGGVDAVRPDLIGGAFVLEILRRKRRTLDKQRVIVERAWDRASLAVVQTIIRTAADHAGHDTKHESLEWLHHLIRRTDSPDLLAAMADTFPQQTVALRECACAAQERMVAFHRQDRGDGPATMARLAGNLNNLAVRLSELGRREEALHAAAEAVTLRRALAAQRPDAFTPDLAGSLNNLAACLSALGQREEALDAAAEAVTLRRALAAQRPDAFTPDLATSLNNLAAFLSDLGRREAALDAAAEAVTLHRALAAQRPDAFTPNLATSLNNLANRLSDLGRREAALDAAAEAVTLRRALAAQRPDAFTPDLATSLNNLAAFLSDLGRREEALDAAAEAAAHYRALAVQRPDAFIPDLAMSLNNLATILSELGRREAALDAAAEAVGHYRALAAQRPDAFTPDLARSMAVLANCRDGLGDEAGALEAIAEAVAILSAPFLRLPQAFAGLMAAMVGQYIERCKRQQREPDLERLMPIIAAFQGLQDNQEESEA